jgi:hypothetical protein
MRLHLLPLLHHRPEDGQERWREYFAHRRHTLWKTCAPFFL